MFKVKNNDHGFSLIEVMIAAGIMGAMSIYSFQFFSDQMKQQNSIESRMEEKNIINEIRLILMGQDNCLNTLGQQVIRIEPKGSDILDEPIDSIVKLYTFQKDPENINTKIEKKVHKYKKWILDLQEERYGQRRIKIHNYQLRFSKDDANLISDYRRGEINFVVSFDRGKSTFGNKIISYEIPLEVEVDKERKLTNCSSMGLPSGGGAGLTVIDAKITPAIQGKTGNIACQNKGLSCGYVQSTNYVFTTVGDNAPLYSPACLNSYNQKLQGVKDGVGLSNVHSCNAKIGSYQTFKLQLEEVLVVCAANFVVMCN